MNTIPKKDYLKSILVENILTVNFTKKDGTERSLRCTLDPNLLPKIVPLPIIEESSNLSEEVLDVDPKIKQPRADNPNVINVWDIENLAWKSFRIDSIISIEI